MQFDATIEKTDKGFGIYFAKVAIPDGGGDLLAVDGFIQDPASSLGDGEAKTGALAALQLGDILTCVNGEDCEGKEVADILGLLRTAAIGPNTLSFSRNTPKDSVPADGEADPVNTTKENGEAPTSGFIGALLKVKSKIRAEIDGDEKELLREQLEDERFEKQWLEEFERLKKQYEAKWETCTYTADEFCGLLYRSSDAQQKEYLLREYPTLMEAWKQSRASSSSSSRVIPEWPAAIVSFDGAVNYESGRSSVLSTGRASPRSIHSSPFLQKAIDCLRTDFMWRTDDLQAFGRRLDADGISSCSGLLEALDARSGFFERNYQSKDYPRLSKAMLRALRDGAQQSATKGDEDTIST